MSHSRLQAVCHEQSITDVILSPPACKIYLQRDWVRHREGGTAFVSRAGLKSRQHPCAGFLHCRHPGQSKQWGKNPHQLGFLTIRFSLPLVFLSEGRWSSAKSVLEKGLGNGGLKLKFPNTPPHRKPESSTVWYHSLNILPATLRWETSSAPALSLHKDRAATR